jgi:hypothetical protein
MRAGRELIVIATAFAAASGVAAQAAAPPCEAAVHRQFDFWIGAWDVFKPDGSLAGRNRIGKRYDGCVLHEQYETPAGYRGESLNVHDAGRRVWHQTWVDNGGTLLLLEGSLRDGSMVMEGATTAADGKVTRHRITWTPNRDGSVRQHWQSAVAGAAWTTVFDGRYVRVAEPESPRVSPP